MVGDAAVLVVVPSPYFQEKWVLLVRVGEQISPAWLSNEIGNKGRSARIGHLHGLDLLIHG